jgi:hypothetical protein
VLAGDGIVLLRRLDVSQARQSELKGKGGTRDVELKAS